VCREMGRGGIEPPTHGFSVRCCKSTNSEKTKTCETAQKQLTPQLTPESRKQSRIDTQKPPSDLAEIVAVWAKLPQHIRQAIKVLVYATIESE